MLKRAACLVGNSSAGIKECSFLGTPVVNIGGRQQGRLSAEQRRAASDTTATRFAPPCARSLATAGTRPSHIYYRPGASQAIVDVLASVELYTQKRFHETVKNQ